MIEAWNALPRILLGVAGLILVVVGIQLGLAPERVTGISLGPTSSTSDIRVAFGGFHVGTGLWALLCVFRPGLLWPGQIATAIVLACAIAFRLFGIWRDAASVQNFVSLSRESVVFMVVLASIWLTARQGVG